MCISALAILVEAFVVLHTNETLSARATGYFLMRLSQAGQYEYIMAKPRKRKKKREPLFTFDFTDERLPKLAGIFFLFIAVYLFIAFTSHLFTWRIDQDVFNPFSWSNLFSSEIVVENWLGRLGAAISNMFFFWGFGLPSYIFVILFGTMGWMLLKREPLTKFWGSMRVALLIMVFFSVLFEFVFRSAGFPWGGAFGQGVCGWMVKFMGNIGTFTLFLFGALALIVWTFNPNLEQIRKLSFPNQVKFLWEDLISGNMFKQRTPAMANGGVATAAGNTTNNRSNRKQAPSADANAEVSTLRPKRGFVPRRGQPDTELEISTGVAEGTEVSKPSGPVIKGEQLAFDLEKERPVKPASLKIGEAPLEIAEPVAKEPPLVEGAVEPEPMKIETENKTLDDPYDPTLELGSYEHPTLELLEEYADQKVEIDRAELEQNKDQIIETLLNYKIEITKIKATIGPTVTLYEIVPAPGIRISKIKNLEDDIALSLAALGIRIIAPIPGKGTIGIEVPNKSKQIVALRETLKSDMFINGKMDLPIALGKTISNEVFVADLAKMPHLLIAGATGQGKSVGINVILMSLLYKKHPSQIKFVLIDPKKVELFPYARLENHFLAYLPGLDEPIVTDTTKVVHTLNSLLIEMDQRYNLLKKAKARNITEYNKKFVARQLNPQNGHAFMPFIVLVIDEFADLIMTAGKEIEHPIGRLAQLSRAVGIHLIIATQRPSVNIITGVIKANFPARIAYRVTAKVDSRTILDGGGADRLIGRGDMLLAFGSDIIRLQCAFVDTPEVERVLEKISIQKGYPTPFYLPEYSGDDDSTGLGQISISELDEHFADAARLIVQNQHGSTSMLQRRMKLGYNRAGRIMDQLEAFGIVGQSEGSKAREVLFFDEIELERYLEDMKTRK